MPGPVNMVDIDGVTRQVAESDVQHWIDRGWRLETGADAAARTVDAANEEMFGGVGGTVRAVGAGVARGATLGLSDVAASALGGEDLRRQLEGIRKHNRIASFASEALGTLVPGGAGALAARAGARIAGTGGGALAQVARAGVRGTVEGGIIGAGQGVSELALSDDPLTAERIAAAIGSNVALGGVTGGVVGAAGKGLGLGLRRAKDKLDEIAARPQPGSDPTSVPVDDLASLDAKGLRAARKAELDRLEAARAPERAQVADEIRSFRRELKESKLWLATKGADDAEVRAIGKRTLSSDRALDRLLDDPRALAENPKSALRQLRIQEAALDDLVTKHGDNLRAKFASDTSGTRMKALDFASIALEKNRALQARITELSAPSSRLTAIDDALAGRLGPKPTGVGVGDVVGDAALGYAVGAAVGIPGIGAVIGAARTLAPLVRKLTKHQAELAARGSKAIGTLLDVGAKVGQRAPALASKTLTSVRFGDGDRKKPRPTTRKKAKEPTLAESYKARTSELRELTAPGPDGAPVMRIEARQTIADRIAPIRAVNALLADRIESTLARAIEFLSRMMPRKPGLPGMSIGPDNWQPSDMEMRTWARYVAAVDDPMGVVERLADGTVTPEDAQAMREVYPEMFAQIQAEIMMQLGELRATLPYERRLALSIFSGVPVDPVLDPRVLSRIQAAYAVEEGTDGGAQAPRAQPQFGSVSKPEPTAAQERGA